MLLYSELDNQFWEIRKVEVFPDGKMDYASGNDASGLTELGQVPLPPLEEIAKNPAFRPVEITAAEFEKLWLEAHNQHFGKR